jgi:SPP1 family predicted phage head-tail adaptor
VKPKGSGAHDRFITVQALTESVGASRRPVESWDTLFGVWAAKTDMGGRERLVAEQLSAPYDTKWELPYAPSIDPDLVDVRKTRRLVVSGRVHDIVSAQEVGRRRGVEVLTLAGGVLT